MSSFRLGAVLLFGWLAGVFIVHPAAASSSASATAQITLVFSPNATLRQAERGTHRELCLQNLPAKHISVTARAQDFSRGQQALDFGAKRCLTEGDIKGVSELIISAE
ncbi:hypothetical protein ACJJID_01310 [Microbulbifer sp. CnH-101-G]|uniref:hypothetical protein n=1 Tax=Microbulbifer sp. CnH-101-G TaxID=3243393 RepID=UPI0040390E15